MWQVQLFVNSSGGFKACGLQAQVSFEIFHEVLFQTSGKKTFKILYVFILLHFIYLCLLDFT